MSVLKSYFNHSIDQNDKVYDTYLMVQKVGKDGSITVVPEKVDYAAIQKRNGTVDMWSLTALAAAGIDPGSLNVHTGATTRMDGISAVNDVLAEIPETNTTKTDE